MSEAQTQESRAVVPPAVAAQAARVNELVRQQSEARRAAAAAPVPPLPPLEPAAAPEPVAAAPVASQTPTPQSNSDRKPHETQEYLSMKGRADAAMRQNAELSNRLSEMQRVLAAMQAAPQQVAPTPTPTARLITPTEETEYGSEMLDVVGRRAREVVTPEVAQLKAEMEALRRQIGGVANVTAQDARQRLFATLDSTLPTWREQNTNPEFLAWLALPDPFSGAIRSSLLAQAFNQNEAGRVLAFFQGFNNEAAPRPAGNSETARAAQAPQVSLESLAAPGRARQSGGTVPPAEKPSFTRAQISRFYDDVRGGKYAGRDDTRKAYEQAIFAAIKEGRIITA